MSLYVRKYLKKHPWWRLLWQMRFQPVYLAAKQYWLAKTDSTHVGKLAVSTM
jgi:hypothetical protein